MTETAPRPLVWVSRAAAVGAAGMVVWVFATAGSAVIHGHPLYPALLGITAAAAVGSLLVSDKREPRQGVWRIVLRALGAAGALAWVLVLAWLRPFPATGPALGAMVSDAAVTVTETATRIVMEPAERTAEVGVLFYPGARVDARAYAAHLRPVAESGRTVIIVKEPLGIAFGSTGDLESVVAARGGQWVVGGHSLGGTVAAMEAGVPVPTDVEPAVVGLLLWASHPAEDVSSFGGAVASISGGNDGLATPAEIEASRADLPASTVFTPIAGAVHAQFGWYGVQPGDGAPKISDADARGQIVEASLAMLATLE